MSGRGDEQSGHGGVEGDAVSAASAGHLAEQKLRALNQLIAGVAHEINNPLTSVQGLTSLLLSEAADDETREDLKIVVSEVTRAVGIVRNLRAFAGQPDEQPQALSLPSLVTRVVDARGYETRARGIELTLELDEGLPPIMAAPTDALQLVLMLLLRAERAIGDLGPDSETAHRVTFTTGMSGANLVLTVEDNGRYADDPFSDAIRALHAAAAGLGGTFRLERGAGGGSLATVELPPGV